MISKYKILYKAPILLYHQILRLLYWFLEINVFPEKPNRLLLENNLYLRILNNILMILQHLSILLASMMFLIQRYWINSIKTILCRRDEVLQILDMLMLSLIHMLNKLLVKLHQERANILVKIFLWISRLNVNLVVLESV